MHVTRPDDDARQRYERDLLALTGLPTAAGREGRVVAWVRAWAAYRPHLTVREDRHGNLLLQRGGAAEGMPIIFTAHMDHPAFVVTSVDGDTVGAEFRGGVYLPFFEGTGVRLWRGDAERPQVGTVEGAREAEGGGFKTATVSFAGELDAEPGDVVTWDLAASRVEGEGEEGGERGGRRLLAPACDDLAAVAAALAALDALTGGESGSGSGGGSGPGGEAGGPDIRVLLTRAEEVGFIGAIGACTSGIIPPNARLIALENSKSFAESPLGNGPIVRVGDATSTFDPALTFAVGQVARRLAQHDDSTGAFKWQRKLMPGGTCEASAYQALGHTATCVCLPLQNYHNMNDDTGRIDHESISLDDFHGLVHLLIALGHTLDNPDANPPLTARLASLFDRHQHLLA